MGKEANAELSLYSSENVSSIFYTIKHLSSNRPRHWGGCACLPPACILTMPLCISILSHPPSLPILILLFSSMCLDCAFLPLPSCQWLMHVSSLLLSHVNIYVSYYLSVSVSTLSYVSPPMLLYTIHVPLLFSLLCSPYMCVLFLWKPLCACAYACVPVCHALTLLMSSCGHVLC